MEAGPKPFDTEQMSGFEALKSFNETHKPFDETLKSSALLIRFDGEFFIAN